MELKGAKVDERRIIDRIPVFTITIAALMIAALMGIYFQQASVGGESKDGMSVELLDHSGNPNDAKDACPHDGNAGKGNDNKGPNGGCRPPKGEYGNAGGNALGKKSP